MAEQMAERTRRALVASIDGRAGACRGQALTPLLMPPPALASTGGERPAPQSVAATLFHALCSECRRGRAGHWSYSLTRHQALLAACRAENRRRESPPAPE